MATNYNGYVIDAQGNATPISDPHALHRGESVARAEVAANAEMLGGMLPSEFAKAGETGGITMELLWENASPGSAFPAQDISISNASEYKFFVICMMLAATTLDKRDCVVQIVPIGFSNFIFGISGGKTARRTANAYEDRVAFSVGHVVPSYGAGEYTEDNSKMKPAFIYGVR